ncbi:MAG: EamA family transporter [Thiotrichales bacterium]|nr:EamA family transporter [Thiotrichales bacterium]MCY4285535.1 EamA family transporter [Thiotrichales bacterium]
MELWIPVTLAAAFMQNLRSALQKHLKGRLSTAGATFCRFVYAVPLAIAYVTLLGEGFGFEWPAPNPRFVVFAMLGGITQIAATALLVHLFSLRNFAVGTTYSKTETVQAAVFGVVILGEAVSVAAALAIGVSLVGVMCISVAKTRLNFANLLLGWTGRAALIGILSGTFFGLSAVAYRAASLSLGGEGFLMQAAFTLACVLMFQTAVMTIWIRRREPGELTRVAREWRLASLVGVSGMLGSAGWFTAMTLENVAYVRALGQVELVFTFAASYFFFRERSTTLEVAGIVLIVAGIVILLLG